MPDARLQRTRDAYPDQRPMTLEDHDDRGLPRYSPKHFVAADWMTRGMRDLDRRPLPAEPSDDDLWGV